MGGGSSVVHRVCWPLWLVVVGSMRCLHCCSLIVERKISIGDFVFGRFGNVAEERGEQSRNNEEHERSSSRGGRGG